MSNDDAKRWKEKYLKSVEQQEKLERRWNARLDLLRSGLVRSTLAAEGTDRAVDQCMKEMREAVRTDEMDAALAALLPRLEKAVLDSEQRRETRIEQTSVALTNLVSQLQALPLPREVSKPLKAFAKQLDARVTQAREIPLLLGELSQLQGQALQVTQLNSAEPAKPGLLQRLFGTHDTDKVVSEPPATPAGQAAIEVSPPAQTESALQPATPADAVPELSAPAKAASVEDEIQSLPALEFTRLVENAAPVIARPEPAVAGEPGSAFAPELPEPEHVGETLEAGPMEDASEVERPGGLLEEADELQLDPGPDDADALYALPASPEPSYSSVASHIESTLLGLLSDLSLPEHHRPQAEAMRRRLEKGLNWYELLPILDDLAVLMLAISDSGQHEFEDYLKQLNERLETFQSNVQAASEGHAEGRSAADQLHSQLREHVDGLQSSVQDAADLSSLKHILESRLEGLLGTMDQHQQQRDAREHEVSAHLQGLAERVAHMEQEAQGYREHLEEQRQKALIDPLTGLPNRAAWGERLEYEVQQWQIHGNTLLIAMLDLDHFKRINDGYGHLAGDKVLKIIATQLRKRLRTTDFIARFGGEEFVLLMANTSMEAGLQLAEKLRAAIEACPFHFKGEPVTVTVSIGLSAFKAGDRSDHVLKRADEALYRAKAAGRNAIAQS